MRENPQAFLRSACYERTQSNSKRELTRGIRMFGDLPDEEEDPDVDQRSLQQKKTKLEKFARRTALLLVM